MDLRCPPPLAPPPPHSSSPSTVGVATLSNGRAEREIRRTCGSSAHMFLTGSITQARRAQTRLQEKRSGVGTIGVA
ncbi:hypothetical protein AAFF_G00105960 [Aldrovandia affinis]|uniref:Uncharacterized protein n=1 Tax=Aldrovandia affinis TaxID=143900 RepID=A0AAD7T241_9TELE|nr:hypothetical protein AAFF_G00105960 [Aldrovandia affinis]